MRADPNPPSSLGDCVEDPRPGWPIGTRLLTAAPGLLGAIYIMVYGSLRYVGEVHLYDLLPASVRNDPDPGPIGPTDGMDMAVMIIFAGIFTAGVVAAVALPRRLSRVLGGGAFLVGTLACLFTLGLLPIGALTCGYVAALAMVRLALQGWATDNELGWPLED